MMLSLFHRAALSRRVGRLASTLFLCRFVGSTLAFARPLNGGVPRSPAPVLEDYNELPLDFPRRDDALVALSAVRKACRVANQLQPSTNKDISTVTKTDLSPVTVGDFAVQAMVLDQLHVAFPKDSFIAEESSTSLEEDVVLAEQVLAATAMKNVEHVKQSIDLGKDYLQWEKRGGRPPRVWCLDPIDGTRGFLRGKQEGGQYCVALALLEVRHELVGVVEALVVRLSQLLCLAALCACIGWNSNHWCFGMPKLASKSNRFQL